MLKRNPSNPLIKPAMLKSSHSGFRVKGVFNPGATSYKGKIILLLRIAEDCTTKEGYISVPYYRFERDKGIARILEIPINDPDLSLKDTRGIVYRGIDYLSTISHIRLASSDDGTNFSFKDKPFLYPCNQGESFGVEDARVTKIEDIYYITYTAVSADGWATSLATTKDFITVQRKGFIFPPPNKDVSIFPEKISGKYYALHRPHNQGFGKPSIWLSESEDLIHWGNHRCILRPREMFWEEEKIGGGAAPIKTAEGWLEIYHSKGRDQIYSLFLVLLDLENPAKVLKRGKKPILYPQAPYEKKGFFPNIVFSNGLIVKQGQRILLYYGCCDENVCLAETTIEELLDTLKAEE